MATQDRVLWGLHTGGQGNVEQMFLASGYIGMSWGQMGDLHDYPADWEGFTQAYATVFPEETHHVNAGQIFRFVHEIQVGHYVAFRPKLTHDDKPLVFLGRIVGPYLYNPLLDPIYPNLRRVEWLRSVSPTRFSEAARRELGAKLTLFQIDTHAAEFFAALDESDSSPGPAGG
jgi:restriction system protein